MKKSRLEVYEQSYPSLPGVTKVDYQTLKSWCKSGKILRQFQSYNEVVFHLYNYPGYRYAFFLSLISYFLNRKKIIFHYAHKKEISVSIPFVCRRGYRYLKDLFLKPFFLKNLKQKFRSLQIKVPQCISLPQQGTPYYLRTDFCFNLAAGGSIGHIAGVLNHLETFANTSPIFLTSDFIPTVKTNIKTHQISHEDRFLDFPKELPIFLYSETFSKAAFPILKNHPPRFIYERYSCGSTSGLELAKQFQVPFILEYNGSEVWVGKHWGKPFRYEEMFLKIEALNLQAAQLIVVVSAPLKEQLVERGIDPHKILVNPNGVDPKKYSPEIDGSPKREALKVKDKIVIGFIGTFGKWHGAEVLTECFGKLLDEYREKIHLLMIGDGIMMSEVTQKIHDYQMESCVTLTGMIPQSEAPEYLAACDILASPHVPNSDGSKFFGSPTKLFEYMAMGKGIVASDLDQIGEVLEHKKTAYLVKPGDQEALVQGLKVLIEDPELRQTLGINAREEVVKNYTWKQHTHKILEKLKELCPSA